MIIHGNSAQPIPEAADARDFPAIWLRYARAVDDRLVLRAVDAADRDAKHPVVEPGAVCVGTGNGSVWVRTDAGAWQTVYEPPGAWRNITLATGVAANPVFQARRMGQQVWVAGDVLRPDGAAMQDQDLGYLPTDCIPPTAKQFAVACSAAGATTSVTGRVIIFPSGLIKGYSDQDGVGTPGFNIYATYWLD